MQYGLRVSEAIACLRKGGFKYASIVLLYSAIDSMAWADSDKEVVGNQGFKNWVSKYMLGPNQALLPEVTAEDLWGARCGVLHTSAPESNSFRDKKARRLFYRSNVGEISAPDQTVIVVSLENLGWAFASGLLYFLDDLQNDKSRDKGAREKLMRVLIDQAV